MRWFRRRVSPRAEFMHHRPELLREWFTKAAATGNPRELIWVSYVEGGEIAWAKVSAEGRLLALVPVVVQFEPVLGGLLEDVLQSRDPRAVVAVFRWVCGKWMPDARAIFNLAPHQLIERSAGKWVDA